MKKQFAVCLLLMISLFVNAQNKKGKNFTYGVKAGLNIASIKVPSGSTPVSPTSITRLNAGVYGIFHLNSSFSIQPELLYTGCGYAINGAGIDGKERLNYLSFPLLAKYTISKSNFSLLAGPQIAYLLNSKAQLAGQPETDTKKDRTNTDLTAIVGAEYQFNFGMNISARYQLGLTRIDNSGSSTTVKNVGFAITVGIKIK